MLGSSAFRSCGKISEKSSFKEKRLIFAHNFKGFSPWFHCDEREMRQNIMAEGCDKRKPLTSSQPGSTEKGKEPAADGVPGSQLHDVPCHLTGSPISSFYQIMVT